MVGSAVNDVYIVSIVVSIKLWSFLVNFLQMISRTSHGSRLEMLSHLKSVEGIAGVEVINVFESQ